MVLKRSPKRVGFQRMRRYWDEITAFPVDDARFVPNYSYGVERPYPGKEVIVAYYQFA